MKNIELEHTENGFEENQIKKNNFSRSQRRKLMVIFGATKFKDRFEKKASKIVKF